MTRYVTRRVMLSIITLWLICTIVFVIVNVLPNDVGRSIAGPFAPQETVDQINERLGTDDPLPTQYVRLLKNTVTFDFGDSFQQARPVSEVIGDAFWRSAKLVVLALAHDHPAGRGRGRVRGAAQGQAGRSVGRHPRAGQLVHPGLRVGRGARLRLRCAPGLVPGSGAGA